MAMYSLMAVLSSGTLGNTPRRRRPVAISRKKCFTHVLRRSRGRREVNCKARVFLQLFFHLGMFVRGVVIADHMQRFIFRSFPVNLAQAIQYDGDAVHSGDDPSVQRVERGEQGGRAVALVIMPLVCANGAIRSTGRLQRRRLRGQPRQAHCVHLSRGRTTRQVTFNPCKARLCKRSRHRPTCTRPTFNSAAISLFCIPALASNTIRAHCANRTLVSPDRVSLTSASRSSAVKLISGAVRISHSQELS